MYYNNNMIFIYHSEFGLISNSGNAKLFFFLVFSFSSVLVGSKSNRLFFPAFYL